MTRPSSERRLHRVASHRIGSHLVVVVVIIVGVVDSLSVEMSRGKLSLTASTEAL
jgi:hypothetical protein